MDELAQSWKKLSLSEVEGRKVDLSRKKKTGDYVVALTFLPIWKTRGNFEVNDAGGNVFLFDFELEVDAEKVMMGEPWAFDRHLVVMERYDGSTPVHDLKFSTMSFLVQIHDLPFSFMSNEVAFSIQETLGAVLTPKDSSEMRGSNFMRIRVAVDITKLLFRG